mgnify:CR=1 FL=1
MTDAAKPSTAKSAAPMSAVPTLPLDAQLCFSIYSASLAIQRVYKPMLDALGVSLSGVVEGVSSVIKGLLGR